MEGVSNNQNKPDITNDTMIGNISGMEVNTILSTNLNEHVALNVKRLWSNRWRG